MQNVELQLNYFQNAFSVSKYFHIAINVLYNTYVYFLKLFSFDSKCFFYFGKFKFDFIVSEFFLSSFSVFFLVFLNI